MTSVRKGLIKIAMGAAVISGFGCIVGATLMDVRPDFSVVAAPAEIDLGVVGENTRITGTATLRNQGKSPAAIDRVWTSCGCTSARASKQVLNPSEECELTAIVKSGQASGRVDRYVYAEIRDDSTGRLRVASVKFSLTVEKLK